MISSFSPTANRLELRTLKVERPNELWLDCDRVFGESRLKIWRAQFHAYCLSRLLEEIFETQKHALGLQYDVERKRYWLNTHLWLSSDIGLVIGDCLRNLRTALDYLVSKLARESGVSDRHTLFPINEMREGVEGYFAAPRKNECGKTLRAGPLCAVSGHYPDLEQIILDKIKPYSAENGGSTHGDLIWRLVSMDNIDKHRLITPVVHFTLVDDIRVGGLIVQNCDYRNFGPDGITLTRGTPFDFSAKANITYAVEFGEDTRLPGKEVVSTLVEGIDQIARVIEIFEMHFQGSNAP